MELAPKNPLRRGKSPNSCLGEGDGLKIHLLAFHLLDSIHPRHQAVDEATFFSTLLTRTQVTFIDFGFTVSAFGTTSFNTPSLNEA